MVCERFNIAPSGKRFRCEFIEPGFVSYDDVPGCGMELLRKNAIEASLQSAIGMALTIGHVPTKTPIPANKIHGRIDKVGYDERTNWFFCEGTVDTDQARNELRAGKKGSVGFIVLETGPGGRDHNITYTQELSRLNFHHLAIVDNPRYDGAEFRLNSVQPKPAMSLFKWIKKTLRPASEAGGAETTVEETGTLPADATLEIDGKQVRLNDVVAAKIAADEKTARENAISGDAEIEYAPGKTAKLSELIASHRANETPAETTDEKKAREETERANAVKAKAAADAKAARENEAKVGAESYRVVQEARQTAAPVAVERANSANTVQEQIARGASRYGSVQGKN